MKRSQTRAETHPSTSPSAALRIASTKRCVDRKCQFFNIRHPARRHPSSQVSTARKQTTRASTYSQSVIRLFRVHLHFCKNLKPNLYTKYPYEYKVQTPPESPTPEALLDDRSREKRCEGARDGSHAARFVSSDVPVRGIEHEPTG